MADAESPESIAPPPPEPYQAPAAEIGKESAAPPPPPQAAAEGSASRSLAAMMEKEERTEEEKPEKSRGGEVVVVETGKENTPTPILEEQQKKVPVALGSFKEESNKVDDLSDYERKALFELKQLVQEALNTNQFTATPSGGEVPAAASESKPKETQVKESETDAEKAVVEEQEQEQQQRQEEAVVSIWGIPLLKDDRSDVILLKFLRARDFKVKDAFAMIRSTVQWRERFKIDEIVNEDLGDDWEKVVFMHGQDRDGHPVCYNVYGEFQNKELYQKAFSNAEKRMRFLRWRIQFLERSIEKLDFSPGGVSTVFQVNDLKNSPGPGKRELRLATRLALHLLQDNYPEFVAKQVFINVPWWHLAFYTMISPFMTQRTKSKFVFASPAKTAETLFKYISPEQVPIQYGGLSVDSCDCNPEFSVYDPATEITLKPGTKQTVEIIIYEQCHIVWELRVVGWEVTYGAEFSPDAKDAYTIIIHKPTKMSPTDEPVVSNSFKVSDLGKIFLTVDNPTSKKKKLLYRFKVKPLLD